MADDELDWKKDRIRQQAKKAKEQAAAVGVDLSPPTNRGLPGGLLPFVDSSSGSIGEATSASRPILPDDLPESPGLASLAAGSEEYLKGVGDVADAISAPVLYAGRQAGKGIHRLLGGVQPEQKQGDFMGAISDLTAPFQRIYQRASGNRAEDTGREGLMGTTLGQAAEAASEAIRPDATTMERIRGVLGGGAGLAAGLLSGGLPVKGGQIASRLGLTKEAAPLSLADLAAADEHLPAMLAKHRHGGLLIRDPEEMSSGAYIQKGASNVIKRINRMVAAGELDDSSPLIGVDKGDVIDALRSRANNQEVHDAIADLYGATPRELRADIKTAGQADVPGQAPNLGSSTASTVDADIAKQLKQVKTTPEGEVKEAYLTPKQISEHNRKQAADLGLAPEASATDREALSQAQVAKMQAYYAKQGGLPEDVINPQEYAAAAQELGVNPGELAQYDLGTQPGAALKKQLTGLAKDMPPLKPAASKPPVKTPNPEPAASSPPYSTDPFIRQMMEHSDIADVMSDDAIARDNAANGERGYRPYSGPVDFTADAAPPAASEPPTVAAPEGGQQYGMSRYTGQRTAGFNPGTIEPETTGVPTNTYDMVAGPGGELVPAPPPRMGYKKYLAGPQAAEADPFASQGSNFFDEVSANENPLMQTHTDIKPFPRMYDDAADPFAPQAQGSFSGAATGATPYTTSEMKGGLRSAHILADRRMDTGTGPNNVFSGVADQDTKLHQITGGMQGPGPWGPPQGPANQPPRPANVARPISSDGLPKKTSLGNWKWTSWVTNTNNMMEQVQSWANWAKKVLADPGAALKARASGFTASIQDVAKANESIDRIGRALDESGKSYSRIGPAMQAAQDYALAALFGRSKAALGLKQPLTNPNFPWAKFSRASVLADDTIASNLFSGPNGPQVIAEGAQAPLLEAYKLALNHTSTEAAAKHVPTMGANGLEEWGGVQDSSKFLRRMNQHSLELMNSNPDVMNEVTSKLGMLPGNEGVPQQAGIAEFQRGYLQPADRQAPLEHLRVYKVVPDSLVLDNGTELPLNDFVHHFVPTRGYGDGTGLPGLFRNMFDRIHLIGEMGSQGMDDPRFLNLIDGADGYLASLGKISPAAKEAFEAMYAGYHHQRTAAGYFGLNMSNNLLLSPMASFARGAGSLIYELAVAAAPLKDMLRPIYQAGMDSPGGMLEKAYSGSKAALLQGWNLAGSMIPGVGKYMTGGGYKQVMSRYGVVPANYAGSALAAIARMQGEVNTLTKTENAFRYLGDNPITWATRKFADAVFGSAEITTAQMERQHAMSYMRESMKPKGISDASLVQLKNNGMNPDMLQWLRQQAGKADIPADEAQEFVNSMVRNGVNRFNKMSANPVFNQRIVNTPAFNIVKPFKNYIYTMARDVEDNGKVIRAIFDTAGPIDGKLKAVASRLGGMAVKYGVVTAGAGLATKAIYNYMTGREGTDWERQAPNKAAALLVGLGSAGVFGPTGEAGDAMLSQFDQKFGTKLRPWGMEQGREVPPPAPLGLDFPLQAGRKIADLGMAAAGRGLYNAGLTPKNPALARAAAQAVGPAARVASTFTQGAAATQQLFGKGQAAAGVRAGDLFGGGKGVRAGDLFTAPPAARSGAAKGVRAGDLFK